MPVARWRAAAKTFAALALSMSIAPAPGPAWAEPPARTPGGLEPLGPVPAGASLSLTLEQGTTQVLGSNLAARLELRNAGTAPFDAIHNGVQGPRLIAVRLEAHDEAGQPVLDPLPGRMPSAGNGPVWRRTLRPGESFFFRVLLPDFLHFDAPGTYRVRAWLDAGWTATQAAPDPVAHLSLVLTEPSPREAVAKVAEVLAQRAEWLEGRRGEVPAPTLSTLSHPVYVEPLLALARTGELHAVEGLAGIWSPSATRALLDLTAEEDGAMVRAATWRLLDRVPKRAGAVARVGGRNLGPGVWTADLAAATRERLQALLAATGDGATASAASLLLERVGEPGDAVHVVRVLNRVLPLAEPRGLGADALLDAPLGLWGAVTALQAFAARGAVPELEPRGAGAVLLTLAVFTVEPAKRSAVADERCLRWLSHRVPFVQELALRALSDAGLEQALPHYELLSTSRDGGLRLAALERFQPLAPRIQGGGALLTLREADSAALLRAAVRMAQAQNLRPHLVEACIDRLTDAKVLVDVLRLLGELVVELESGTSSGNSRQGASELAALQTAWRTFAAAHAEALAAGRRWSMDDPALVPALFGSALRFKRRDGTDWPGT